MLDGKTVLQSLRAKSHGRYFAWYQRCSSDIFFVTNWISSIWPLDKLDVVKKSSESQTLFVRVNVGYTSILLDIFHRRKGMKIGRIGANPFIDSPLLVLEGVMPNDQRAYFDARTEGPRSNLPGRTPCFLLGGCSFPLEKHQGELKACLPPHISVTSASATSSNWVTT